MKAKDSLFILLVIISGYSFISNKLPPFEKIDKVFLDRFNEGRERWTDGRSRQILYFQRVKDSRLMDEEFIYKTGEEYYRLAGNKLGMRVWKDSVYYYKTKKDHTNSGWKRKFGDGMFATDPPKEFDNNRLAKYYNVVLKYENDSLIQTHVNNEIKRIWELPDGLVYIAEPGLGVVQSEHIDLLINRIEQARND